MFIPLSICQCGSIVERFHILHVLNDHKGDLKSDRIFKNSQIQPGTLLQLVQATITSVFL